MPKNKFLYSLMKTVDKLSRYRTTVMTMAIVVVFITTYLLILPALTLEKTEAQKQGGIDVPIAETLEDSLPDEIIDIDSDKIDESLEDSVPDVSDDQSAGAQTDSEPELSEPGSSEFDEVQPSVIEAPQSNRQDGSAEAVDDPLSFKDENYKVSIVDEAGVLPEGTSISVEKIDEKDKAEEYDNYYRETLSALQNEEDGEKIKDIAFVSFYDISLMSNDMEIEPAEGDKVNVKIEYDKDARREFIVKDSDNVRIVHFAEDEKTGELTAEVLDSEENNVQVDTDSRDLLKSAEFETDSFSIYAVVYTVDFHWYADGESFEFSIPGGSFISFSELVETLGITDQDVNAFVANVESIKFSDPDLIWVGKVEEDTTVGDIKSSRGLECEYSSDLTEEQIAEINAQTIDAGDWALISLKPFDTEEALTVTMKNGEVFEIKVTDVSYQGSQVTDPNGKTVALLNMVRNNALQSTAHSTYGRLQANEIQVNGNRITSVDPLTTWTFTRVPNTTNQYYIQASNGYLNITNGNLFVTNQQQALLVQTKNDGTIRIRPTNTNTAINLVGGQTSNGYGTYASDWDSNQDEWFTMYEISDPIIPHVTVHYVDRNGNELTDVEYTGNNPLVTKNSDGSFNIPFDWGSGQTSDTSVDLRAQFSKEGWTYGSTHLDGVDHDGTRLKHEGYVIDSVLTRSGSNLQFKSDSGATSAGWGNNPPKGNLMYGELTSFSLSGNVNARPANNGTRTTYATSGNKDIYVILDPPALHSAGSGSGPDGEVLDIDDPTFEKTMQPNEDGTYTLSLKVKTHAKNASETNKANVLFIVDTSSSMRAVTTSNSRNRIMDTHDAVLEFGDKLLAYNEDHPGAVEVSMITFDGGVNERLDWTSDKSLFDTSVNTYLKYYYLHLGTDWEDGLKTGLEKILTDTDDDPTFLVFFTDGEPSQYTSFHGAATNGTADPTGYNTEGQEQITGGYTDFFSYFLSRETAKDEMRAIVNADVRLYGIYAYNTTNEHYDSYNGEEDGALMLHNAIRYGYNTTSDLTGNRFFEAHNTNDVKKAFDAVFNSITETVGLTNLVIHDGIAAGVTSTEVVDGDVSAFTYTIRNKSGNVEYKVTVAPNGVPEGSAVEDGTPMFWIGNSEQPNAGEIQSVPVTKVKTNPDDGTPVTDPDTGKIETEIINVEVYYYKDPATDREYIMPISTTGESIDWDLSPLGLLQDGYTYEVDFIVWPNQEAYDLVADLNNGKRPDLEETADWESQEKKKDSSGKEYRQGGFPDYPYISRYEETGIYSAMSNTEQTMDYYVDDKKSENGEETEVISGPFDDPIDPPDPMPLTHSLSKLEKEWNVNRDPNVLYELLYGGDEPLVMSFDITQDNRDSVYKTIELGWKSNNNPDDIWDGHYEWEPGTPIQTIEFNDQEYEVGTHWASDFSIATGLMLSEAHMDELGLNKSTHPSGVYNGTRYYILEEGHDYTVSEPQLSYDFDFVAPTFHPMLVDGTLKSVNFTIDEETKTVDFTDMTDNETDLSSLKIQNTLRGYIHVDKVVVDEDGETVLPSDDTKFEYTIELNNSNAPFDGDHIPWYGINSLFYHDEEENYYQVKYENGELQITTETGGPYPADCEEEGGFNPDEAGAQTVTYVDESEETQTVVIYGNQMTMSNEQKTVTATLHINQDKTLNIANVPIYTTYTVTEGSQDGYSLIKIVKEIRKDEDDHNPESTDTITNISNNSINGTIVSDRDNHLIFYNRALRGALKIHKSVTFNGSEGDDRETVKNHLTGTYTFTIYKDEDCQDPYLIEGQPKTVSLTITDSLDSVTSEEVGELPPGYYWLKEDTEGHDALPLVNPVKVRVEAGKTGNSAVIADFTNDYVAVPVPLEIVKVKKGTTVALPNAKFSITMINEDGKIRTKLKEGSETEREPVYTEEKATDSNGKILFESLLPGLYEISETEAPEGYVFLEDITFYIRIDSGVITWVDKIENEGAITWVEKSEGTDGLITFEAAKISDPESNAVFTVENEPGAALPNAGGIGTTIFYVLGSMLLLGCGVYLISRRRVLR